MRKLLSKNVLYTLMVAGCMNLFLLNSCNDEAEKTETTTTTTTTETPPPTTTTTDSPPPPKDSLSVKAADSGKMDTASTKPVEQGVKK